MYRTNRIRCSRLPRSSVVILKTDSPTNPEFLMEQRPKGNFLYAGKRNLYGGHADLGESPEECALRELNEELTWWDGDQRVTPSLDLRRVWRGRVVSPALRLAMDVDLFATQVPAGLRVDVSAKESARGSQLARVPVSPEVILQPENYTDFSVWALGHYLKGGYPSRQLVQVA